MSDLRFISVPKYIFDAALNYILHCGWNQTFHGKPHPQELLVNGLEACQPEAMDPGSPNLYRNLLLEVLDHIDPHEGRNEYVLHDIIEALDACGDGHLVPEDVVDACDHIDGDLAERVTEKNRKYLAAVEAAKTPEQHAADALEEAKYERHLIYKSLSRPMRELLMILLAGFLQPYGYTLTMDALKRRGLVDAFGRLTNMGMQIAIGTASRQKKWYASIQAVGYRAEIKHPYPYKPTDLLKKA